MKLRRRAITALVLLALLGSIVWAVLPPKTPTVHFVRFEDSGYTRNAIFKIVNHSSSTFYYPGIGPESPITIQQTLNNGEWKKPEVLALCGNGLGEHSIPPRSTIEFVPFEPTLPPLDRTSDITFKIGTYFSQKPTMSTPGTPTGIIGQTLDWLRTKLDPPKTEIAPTWSEPVHDIRPKPIRYNVPPLIPNAIPGL